MRGLQPTVGGNAAWIRTLWILGLSAASLPSPAMADDPRPTSNFGSMPNGWAGHSLHQSGMAPRFPRTPPTRGGGDHGDHGHGDHGGHHGDGHHGDGHHGHGHQGHGHHGHGHHGHAFYGGWPYGYGYGGAIYGYGGYAYRVGGRCAVCLSPTCFNPYCGLYSASGVGLSVGVTPIAAAPLWVAQRQALQVQQMAAAAAGANRNGVPQVPPAIPPAAALPGEARDPAPAGAEEIRRRVAVLRESKPGGRQRADRLIAMADRYFADQDYRRAASKYRQAIAQAADYSTAHFRVGHAYIATGDLELALTYFLMALELSGSTERPGFTLEDMYRGNQVAKQTHIDTLSDAALRQPDDGGLLMLVGISLHYDGQPLRARAFFEQAARLPGAQQSFAAMFLPPAPADALDRVNAPADVLDRVNAPAALEIPVAPVRFEG